MHGILHVVLIKKSIESSKHTHAVSTRAVSHGHSETKQSESTTNYYAKTWSNSVCWSAIRELEMGKCGVFIPSHSHQVIPILIPIPIPI